MQNHNWERVSDCLNGPHLWQCKICHEWTRSYKQPAPDAPLIDPENGEHYTSRPCNVFDYKKMTGSGANPQNIAK